MRSGRRLVLLLALVAAAAAVVFRLYGDRALRERPTETPVTAARDFVVADNTVVGVLGGVRRIEPVEIRASSSAGLPGRWLDAEVVGARATGRLYADVEFAGGRWVVRRAALRLADGRRLPLAGEERPALEPR